MANNLGISYGHHDSAITLVKEDTGEVLFASQEERFSGIKHDASFPKLTLKYVRNKYAIDNVTFFNKEDNFIDRYKTKKLLKKFINISNIDFINHHDAHAYSSIGMNKGIPGAVMVADTKGGNYATSLGYWDGSNITWLKRFNYPNSLGLLYSAVTSFSGLRPLYDENIIMSASHYGKPIWSPLFKKHIVNYNSGNYKVIPKEYLINSIVGSGKINKVDFDLCASIQDTIEKIIVSLATWLKNETKTSILYYSGGLAYNCVANSKLFSVFDDVFINPAAGDAGCAMGAAWNKNLKGTWENSFHGVYSDYTDDDIDKWVNYIKKGNIAFVIGGKAEWGPRALGNRSLLCIPTKDNINKLNYIKNRIKDNWRPYAPMVLSEYASDYYITKNKVSKEMLFTFDSMYSNNIFPTGRLQMVDSSQDIAYKILTKLKEYENCRVLINTSLNERGKPIPNTRHDISLNWFDHIKDFVNF